MANQSNLQNTPPGIVVCVGAVVYHEGQVLLVRQAEGHPLEGQWTIPWGLVDPGEVPEEAVLREIEEEAGVTAEITGLLGFQNLPDPWDGWIGIIFLCRHLSGTPRSDGGKETDQARYFSLEALSAFEEEIEIWCEWLARRSLTERPNFIPPESNNPYAPKIAFLA
jgi:8-oxo-dGTP diphosphatase